MHVVFQIEDQFKGPKADLQHSLDERWGHLLTPESRLDIRHSLLKQLNNPKTDGEYNNLYKS